MALLASAAARTLGVPIRVILIDHINKLWLLVDKQAVAMGRELPRRLGNNTFTRYDYRGWHGDDGLLSRDEMGVAWPPGRLGKSTNNNKKEQEQEQEEEEKETENIRPAGSRMIEDDMYGNTFVFSFAGQPRHDGAPDTSAVSYLAASSSTQSWLAAEIRRVLDTHPLSERDVAL
ncbi:hypothetical protein VTH06DRAFT_5623 [Thermothelomyces fergusii]